MLRRGRVERKAEGNPMMTILLLIMIIIIIIIIIVIAKWLLY